MLGLRSVNAGYGPTQVVWNLDLEVGKGEVVGLVGRNGVGKTTTLKSVVGLCDLMSGEIRIGGRSFAGIPTSAVASMGVGYVAQQREVCPDLTVEENLRLPLYASRRPLERLKPVLERFPRLRERARQKAGSLSGGERKLLAFARIMLLEPSVYLIDEPTEGLMPFAVAEISALIGELRARGAAVLLVEQNLGVVRELSDRVYLMNVGRVEKCVAELDDQTASEYLAV
jgi:branched-chain amino acid transport system ATP-binding protein